MNTKNEMEIGGVESQNASSGSESKKRNSEWIVEKIKSIIANAPERLKNEFEGGSGNSWVASFSTDLMGVDGWFQQLIMNHPENEERYKKAAANLESSLTRFKEVKSAHKRKETITLEVKQELLATLDIFRESE